jgi:hypothetical protein
LGNPRLFALICTASKRETLCIFDFCWWFLCDLVVILEVAATLRTGCTYRIRHCRVYYSTCRLRIFRNNFGYVETLQCNVSKGFKLQLICLNQVVSKYLRIFSKIKPDLYRFLAKLNTSLPKVYSHSTDTELV